MEHSRRPSRGIQTRRLGHRFQVRNSVHRDKRRRPAWTQGVAVPATRSLVPAGARQQRPSNMSLAAVLLVCITHLRRRSAASLRPPTMARLYQESSLCHFLQAPSRPHKFASVRVPSSNRLTTHSESRTQNFSRRARSEVDAQVTRKI
jgi:hypothetical protein